MFKKNITNSYKRSQKSNVSSQNIDSPNVTASIRLNQNPDAWLIDYATTILDLVHEKEAVQFIDNLMGNNEARNHCIADAAHTKSQELNQTINSEIAQMTQFQAFTMAGLQAKARVLKAVSSPLEFDEGFISYEVNMLLKRSMKEHKHFYSYIEKYIHRARWVISKIFEKAIKESEVV